MHQTKKGNQYYWGRNSSSSSPSPAPNSGLRLIEAPFGASIFLPAIGGNSRAGFASHRMTHQSVFVLYLTVRAG